MADEEKKVEEEKKTEAAPAAEASKPAEPSKAMETGKVKWFSNLKGFGFLQKEGDEKDIFVHYSFVQGEGYKKLKAGDEVTFEIEDTGKGPQARNVVRTKKAEKAAGDDSGKK